MKTPLPLKVQSKYSDESIRRIAGQLPMESNIRVLLRGDTRVTGPDGRTLMVYRPGALDPDMLDAVYPTLHSLKDLETSNRSNASGYAQVGRDGTRFGHPPVASAIVGAFDPTPNKLYCRLTAWTARELGDRWPQLFPLFQSIGERFAEDVPDRYAAQMSWVGKTQPGWVIDGTPFTTITVNNTYSTGIHTDRGDLDEGFSTLACLRRGDFTGGYLTFPEFGLGVDMQHGDVLLMNAHHWHGNTRLELLSEDAERISIVSYFRTRIAECGTPEEEEAKALEHAESRASRALGQSDAVEEMAIEALVGHQPD